LFSDKA